MGIFEYILWIFSVKNFLIRKHKYIELITSQSVFEYVANAYDPDDTIMDNIRRQRIPFKPRTMTIRDAFNFMIEKVFVIININKQNIPLILIDWTDEEKKKYARIQKFVYPNVVTLSQIYTMICQRLVDVSMKWWIDSRMIFSLPVLIFTDMRVTLKMMMILTHLYCDFNIV